MEASSDWRSILQTHPIFAKLRANFERGKVLSDSKQLMQLNDGVLYVWDAHDSCIHCTNVKSLASNLGPSNNYEPEQKFVQTLLCSNSPRFNVEKISFNAGSTSLALSGYGGVSVMQLPRRWGKQGVYEGGKNSVNCRTTNIGDRLVSTHSRVKLLQMSWVPDTFTDSHVMLLTTDNKLRMYNINEPQVVVYTHNLSGTDCLAGSHQTSMGAHELGERAIAFHFGTSIEVKQTSDGISDVKWPVYILWANGDVYTLHTSLNTSHCSVITGPLHMYPPAEDNYGTDACDILLLPTVPNIIVIATNTGRLYHAVVLDNEKDTSDSFCQETTEQALYVTESIEIELSLTTVQVGTEELLQDDYSCPVKLHADPSTTERYHCSHNAGAHSVLLPWIQQYQHFCKNDKCSTLDEQAESVVEHLICTKPLASSPCLPLYGLDITSDRLLGTTMICLTVEYNIITIPLMSTQPFAPPSLLCSNSSGDIQSPIKKLHTEAFDEHIRKLLQRNTSNPIIKTGSSTTLSSQECFQLLSRATQILREQYLHKQDLAHDDIEHRIRLLQRQKQQQLDDLRLCAQNRVVLTEKANKLSDRNDDVQEKQQKITERCEIILRRLMNCTPSLSDSERIMHTELREMEDKLKQTEHYIKQVKTKHECQQNQMESSTNQKSALAFNAKQITQLRTVLSEGGTEISKLMKDIRQLKVDVDA